MTTTYSGNPAASSKDAVRFHLGDVGPTTWQLTDEEIAYLLQEWPQPLRAASVAARNVGAKYADQVSKSVGELSIEYAQRAEHWYDLAEHLDLLANTQGRRIGQPYAGGTSKSDRETRQADTDQMAGYGFDIGMHDIESVRPTNPLLGD